MEVLRENSMETVIFEKCIFEYSQSLPFNHNATDGKYFYDLKFYSQIFFKKNIDLYSAAGFFF